MNAVNDAFSLDPATREKATLQELLVPYRHAALVSWTTARINPMLSRKH